MGVGVFMMSGSRLEWTMVGSRPWVQRRWAENISFLQRGEDDVISFLSLVISALYD
ncbi:hypothetical protein KSP40_PGU019294 [Platanthera guangdongensis]|uniref:Uncharacterized protein n=1 Tax=Platanthera guangdongensis TaxID=2320717 RepID=A0ABR2M1Y5_9ASPA